MRIVAPQETREVLREHGAVYVAPRAVRCCKGRQYVLDASLRRPRGEYELVHATDGFQVWTTTGLRLPEELHLELDRKGRLQAFWNGQGWIG
ncbi:MAG: hypothetical protein ACRC50_06400 [Gaiella sp.]